MVKSMFDWPTLHRDTKTVVKHCANCQFHAAKAPAAPIQGHLTADSPGQVVAMDVLHMAKDTDCSGYVLIVIGVFSRYAMGVIVPDLKSTTIATALRDGILKHAWGRPEKWVCDGASYFKAECRAGIDAWAGTLRVSAAHHAESYGIIERHNRIYLGILKWFGNEKNCMERALCSFI